MQYRKLGKTDISVSAIAMGCWALAGDATWGPQDMAESVATVHAALDAGVNLFDTAEGYGGGDSESALGQALLGRRHEAVIATKVSRANLSADEVRRACENSLQRLRTDYVDLYQIHWPSRTVPLPETMEALERLREQGKVRAIGVCNFGLQDLSDLLAIGWPETNQLPYSLLWRAIEYEHPAEVRGRGHRHPVLQHAGPGAADRQIRLGRGGAGGPGAHQALLRGPARSAPWTRQAVKPRRLLPSTRSATSATRSVSRWPPSPLPGCCTSRA